MSVTRPANEYEALVHVMDRVARRFPVVAEETLRELVVEEFTRFDVARVRTFIPVLVEGNVLRTLRDADAAALRAGRKGPH